MSHKPNNLVQPIMADAISSHRLQQYAF